MRPDKAKVGCELKVPAWVPQAARKQINELWASPLAITDENQQLLKRLATYTSMKTEVWEKLPSNPKIPAGEIIEWAFTAYAIFHSLRRPHPKTKTKGWIEWSEHRAKHAHLTDPAYVSNLCFQLRDAAHDDIAASAQRAQPAADELNGRQVPAQQGSAQNDGIAAPQQYGSPTPPAQKADIPAPYRVSRSMMQGTPEQRRPVTQADLDEINAGLAREGIEPVRQPAPRTPLRSGEKPAIKQEAEESSEVFG